MKDAQGLSVTTGAPEVIAAVDAFRDDLLAIGPGAIDVLAAADAHPGTPLLEAYSAAIGLFGQSAEGDRLTERHLARAAPLKAGATDRERALLAAIETLHARRHEAGTVALEALVADHPRDLVSAKLLEFAYYLQGQQHSGARFLAAMEAIAEPNRGDPLFGSMHAFALELTGRYDEAIDVAERASETRSVNPWADHALGHALHKSGRITDGVAAMAARAPLWNARAPFIRGHNSWHLALLRLEMLETDDARAMLGAAVLPAGETPVLVQLMDGISLLWRIEMAGGSVDAGDWARMADLAGAEAGSAYCAFQSAHIHFVLARAGLSEEQGEARTALAADVATLDAADRPVWDTVGLPLVDGVAAFASGDHRTAARHLGPIVGAVAMVGGSDAQVDLFRQTAMLALSLSGDGAAAGAILDGIVAGHPPSPLQERWRQMM